MKAHSFKKNLLMPNMNSSLLHSSPAVLHRAPAQESFHRVSNSKSEMEREPSSSFDLSGTDDRTDGCFIYLSCTMQTSGPPCSNHSLVYLKHCLAEESHVPATRSCIVMETLPRKRGETEDGTFHAKKVASAEKMVYV